MKKKKKNKKWLHLAYFFLFAFFLGFIYTLLVYVGIWHKITLGFKAIPFWAYPLWLIFSFYFTLTCHELGHFFSFIFQKVSIRALYITIFIFYKSEKGFRISINPKLWVLFGGLVVPELGVIDNEETYQKKVKAFTNALITAPIVTIVLLISSWILTILLMIYSNHSNLIGLVTLNTIFITLLSLLYIYTFRLSNPIFYGDIVAHKKMKTDQIFQMVQISQYTMFSLVESDSTEAFLFDKTRYFLKQTAFNYSLMHIMLLTQYIEGILYKKYEIDLEIDSKIRNLNINQFLRNEQGFMLANDLAYYYYVNQDVDKAYQVIKQIYSKEYTKLNKKLFTYIKKKSYHLLHLEDNHDFLSNKENIYLGAIWIFDRLIDPFLNLNEQHEPFPFVTYATEVNLEVDEDKEKSDIIA
ncbi:MAG: hypothetical protein RBT45_01035 [Acholeplasmataceae bacterium]|jgi:hypothetical protein|nr:hypothetical protein [Acholeplasmataceae bacterium]